MRKGFPYLLALMALCLGSCIENDIPYPIVKAAISDIQVESQCDEKGQRGGKALIDKANRSVQLFVDDSVDISRLKITRLSVTDDADVSVVNYRQCLDYEAFPRKGFESLFSLSANANTRVNFSQPLTLRLSTYQDYDWTVSVSQIFLQTIRVEGQIGEAILDNYNRNAILYVSQDISFKRLKVFSFDLGGQHGTVVPDPTAYDTYDFSQPVKFQVCRAYEQESKEWTVYVYPKRGEASPATVSLSANPWSHFAKVAASVTSSSITIDPATVEFQYKTLADSEWSTAHATLSGGVYSAKLTNLTPGTDYSYKLSFGDGSTRLSSGEQSFTTEGATPLPNGNMDHWYTPDGKFPYPCTQEEYDNNHLFWDTSNAGSALMSKVVTSGSDDARSGMSARLASSKVLSTIAAASLYVGSFGKTDLATQTAKVNFGRPFSARPSSIKGYFKYSTGAIDVKGKKAPANVPDRDLWSCYWALMRESFVFDNNDIEGTSVDWPNDNRVVAYGSLPDDQCVESSEWKAFEVPLTYRTLEKPDNLVLVLVFSASKYGDYMTGSTSSVLYIDDLELVYDEPRTAE